MLSSQLQDVASWAGKGNVDALQRQFPQAAEPGVPRAANPEVDKARELTRMRIEALRAQLRREDSGSPTYEAELEVCRAFISLGQLERSEGRDQVAKEAMLQGLEHLASAREQATASHDESALWRCQTVLAQALAEIGLSRFSEAKATLHEALGAAAEALGGGDFVAAEQLAQEIVDAVHNAHEQTDDRKGLEVFTGELQALLRALRLHAAVTPDPIERVPVITAADRPPVSDGRPSVTARLLERVVLICIATGRDKDMEIVRKVFQEFRIARESPSLLRLLAMLQSSGHLLES
ncbi:unnamed protein product [Polarella glacialis]|uniref:Uncharacterized protein n=1 Tax=Polarella glacialis TaxID=89957 RepID=A0A813HFE4_POLGL|nr:unnamed protein product [Polarella glacialis]